MVTTTKNQEQKNVNAKGFDESLQLNPAGYHYDRAQNIIFGTSDNVHPKRRNVGLMPPTEAFKRLVTYFQPDNPSPAGGWYLVKEQREWLRNSLVELIRKKHSQTGQLEFQILEAGIASFNHHFSYLVILKEVIEQLSIPELRLFLTVTDKAFFPLFCIDAINKATFGRISTEKKIHIFGTDVTLTDHFIKWLGKSGLLDDDRIQVRSKQYDLTDHQNTNQLGSFDFITEHFITAVIDNFVIVDMIRRTYSAILKKGGYLLDASGITPHIHAERFDQFIDIHEKYGLVQSTGQVNVWDPYGMRSATLAKILAEETVEVPYDNGLFTFQKK